VDPILDSVAGGRPNFLTSQWSLVVAASAQGDVASRDALEELYRLYCYPVYAFIRHRSHGRQDAQDLTQDFFVHLVEKSTLARADPQRGRFRSFLRGALDYFLPMPPNAPALANEAATASRYFRITRPRRIVTSLQRPGRWTRNFAIFGPR
jgi:hypothetical protein